MRNNFLQCSWPVYVILFSLKIKFFFYFIFILLNKKYLFIILKKKILYIGKYNLITPIITNPIKIHYICFDIKKKSVLKTS